MCLIGRAWMAAGAAGAVARVSELTQTLLIAAEIAADAEVEGHLPVTRDFPDSDADSTFLARCHDNRNIYQLIARRGRQRGIEVFPHRFRHHFSHTWLDCGGAEGDLMELDGWTSP